MATRFQLLPEVFDVSAVFTGADAGGTLLTLVGASLQRPPEQIARLALLGQMLGFFAMATVLIVGLVAR